MDLDERDVAGLIARAAANPPRTMSVEDMELLLSVEDPVLLKELFDAAYAVKLRECGRGVALRGLVEAGNCCAKDCYYCGIRKSNAKASRYTLDEDEIVGCAEQASRFGYGSLVIQSGEIESEAHTRSIERILARIAPLGLGVTLSLGEQEESVYRRWREAGATRYLLRIETSSPRLYSTLHPAECSWARRVECLRAIKRCGYQLGTGVMCALPGQTMADLARDIAFYAEVDADMIGMGPYIPHPDTPLAAKAPRMADEERLLLGLKMIAVTRLYLHDVNIAASTALQALAHDGRERGILAGANVIMPNVTDTKWRRSYTLYDGKPCLDENAKMCQGCLERRVASIGEHLLYGQLGDSRHFVRCHVDSMA